MESMTTQPRDDIERAHAAAQEAYENLARLGETCGDSRADYLRLTHEREAAVRGVARWGFTQRELAQAARLTPQRVGQILAAVPTPRITQLR